MTFFSGLILFTLIWWMAFFCMLPLHIRHDRPVRGEMPGAPSEPRMQRKVVYATVLTCVLWLAAYALVKSDLVSFRVMATGMRM